ncbi:MAG: PKD domain-containing protein [Chitinophagaceae bacterium]|nr:PKD domain-containing protein [Chitinophagaceae bacterium]
MKLVKKSLIVFSLLLSWWGASAQDFSNRGRDFWVGYGHHQYMEPGQNNSQEMVIYLSAEQPANVTVTIDGTTWVRNYSIPANTVIATEFIPKAGTIDARLISVPCSFVPPGTPCGGEGVFVNKGIHIVSDVPIVAYAHIFGSVSSGATMLLPTDTWGYSYTSINSQQIDAAGPAYTWVYVIAKDNNTVIRVTPSVPTRTGQPGGVSYDITLQRGEIYQVVGQSDASGNGNQFTGTTIKSIANPSGQCYPVAVFSGSSRTRGEAIPCGTSSGRDNDMQQAFPQQAWGKRYLTAPFSAASGPSTNVNLTASTFQTSVYKIVVKDPTTVVKRNGVQITGLLSPGNYYQFSSNTADYIESDKPIMIGQFMSGGSGCNPGSWGDPEMVFLSPIEQAIKNVGFYRNNRQSIYANYVTVIIPTAGVASLRIDGSATFNHTYAHPNLPGYSVVVKGWQASQSQSLMYSDSAFTALTYGLGSAESYAYNAGTYIRNLSAVSSIHNTLDPGTAQHAFTCTNTPFELSVLMAYQPTRLDWLLSQVGSTLSPNADVIDNAPVSSGTVIVNGITYYKYTLPGTYSFNTADTFDIPINGYHPNIENCYNREQLRVPVIVKGKPIADFSFSHSGCTLDTVQFTGAATTSNSFTIRDFNWTFPGPVTATGQLVKRLLPPGVHNISLNVVSNEGCVSDTIKQITIYDKPPAEFAASPASICQGTTFTFTDTSSATVAVNTWYWDFGNNVTQTITTGPSVTYSYPQPGTYTVKHVTRSSATCVSDTVRRVVIVYEKPFVSFTNNASGCLDVSGLVQFTGIATVGDGQAINTYLWNFNDPNATGTNPNTAAVQNPSHNFQQGTYNINLSVMTANGCVKDTTITVTFNLKPQLAYPTLNAVCENTTAAISVATGSVTNGVTGTGVYRGPGTSSAGAFSPLTAGPGTHTIWYVFTTSANCKDSISQTILVNARPRTSFTLPNGGCLPTNGQVQFTNTTTIPDGQAMTWAWNFNDPNANGSNPNTSTALSPSHNYLEGTYNIVLQATTSNGCVKDTTVTATFSLTPSLAFAPLAAICENAAVSSVASASVTNGATGVGVYSGPGTTSAGVFNPAQAGPGNHTITYTFTTAGGCIQPITQNILVNAKPRPNFSFPNGGCLPASGQVQFTNSSTIADAQTMTWLWTFNDPNSNAGNPNTSTAFQPTHNFVDGTYNLNLQATSSNGCVKDTTITTTFSITPLLSYPALSSICENAAAVSVATAAVTNGATGTGVYSGAGTTSAGMFNPASAGPGDHVITYTFTTAGGCIQSIPQTIHVYAKPRTTFSFPTGACLAPNGQVQFTNNSTIPDGQAMTWQWTFNDPNANAGNPNTSTALSPTHNFNEGTFAINLMATSANGCTKDTTINATFKVTPVLNYPALTAVCESVASFSVANATVTNGILGNGVYSGPGTSAAGMFNPAAAGYGTHPINYIFTTIGGCVQSIAQNITVHARPRTTFSFTSGGCLPANGQAQFSNNTIVPDGQALTWQWTFNDPNANAGNPNTSTAFAPTHNFSEGTYNINLLATSSNGCVKDTTIAATFKVTPVVVFPALANVCQNPGAAPTSVGMATVTNGVSGTGVYSGPGTTPAGLFDPNVAGPGTHTINYTFTSAGGCIATASGTIQVYPRPMAAFTVTPDICLGQTATITNSSTIPSGSITTWNWNLGNGNSPSYTNGNPFTATYPAAVPYTVQMVAVSDRGCFSESVSRQVAVHPLPAVDFAIPAGICMPNGNAVFNNQTVVPDNSALTYLWNFGDGSGTSTATHPTYVYASPGSYSVQLTATSAFGCTATSVPKVVDDFFDKPVALFDVTPTELCQGVNTVFMDNSFATGSSIQSWKWNFDDGSPIVTTQTPTKKFNNPGEYDVTLTVTNAVGCVSDPYPKTVKVHLQPVIDAGRSFVVPQGTTIQFEATANSSSLTFSWSPAFGLSSDSTLKPSLIANGDQRYTLTATGEFGCTATDFMNVAILKPVHVPNVFSPNNDGVHDRWLIPNLADYPGCNVAVFNRYGQQVFYSSGYSTPWDGTVNGKGLPVGVYYYVITLENGFKPISGSVTIVK